MSDQAAPQPGRHRQPPEGRSPEPGRHHPRRRSPGGGSRYSRVLTVGGRTVAAVVAVAVLVTSATAWSLNTRGSSNAIAAAGNVGVVGQGPAVNSPGPAPATAAAAVDPARTSAPVPAIGAENILLVGVDSRTDAQGNPLTAAQQALIGTPQDGGGVNTDTMLVLHIPAGGGQATAISLPRDTWMGQDIMNAPGVTGPDQHGNQVHYQPGKLNGYYGTAKFYDEQYLAAKGVTGPELERESDEAGRTMLIKVIQELTGIKINHYAEVNLLGFYLMSEAIGGVPVCLRHAVDDPWSGAHFPKGDTTVEGRTALQFVRQRHGLPGGDLDRIRREQAFLGSAANKIISVGTLTSPSRLSALLDAANRSIVLDSGFDLLTFADQMHSIASGDIHFVTIPTHNATDITSTDALATNVTQVRAMFADVNADQPLPVATTPARGPTTGAAATQGAHPSTESTVPRPGSTSSSPSAPTSAATGGYQVPCVN